MNGFTENAKKENVAAGILGAFLFSLAGAACWIVLDLVGMIASLSGFVGVVCAIYGYKLFAKKESVRGIVIATVIAFIVLAVAWFFSFSIDVYNAYNEWYEAGEIDFTLTFAEAIDATLRYYIPDFSVSGSYFVNLGLGLLFAIFGSFSVIGRSIKKVKTAENAAAIGESEIKGASEYAENPIKKDSSNKWNE